MGFGFLESVYEKCLLIELRKACLDAESQKPITIYYDNEIVGEFVADIIVNDTVILELKSVRQIINARVSQIGCRRLQKVVVDVDTANGLCESRKTCGQKATASANFQHRL